MRILSTRKGLCEYLIIIKGAGASGFVSKVDDNGGILEITVTNGGENYNDLDKNTSVIYILNEFNDFEHDGYGFL